uniref:Lectin/glucanase superfamily protein n=1 Tax=viral metagenome TaxID=1070528 RepID=A0A6C0D3G3_9ZZZZ
MNLVLIILGIIIVFLVYILYQYFYASSSSLSSTANLNGAQAAITSLASPANTSYGYSIWIYVNNWDSSTIKTIFNRAKNLKLYLDQTAPTLKLDVTMSDGTTQTAVVTTNFPIQRWVFLAVSADGQYFDVYMDGKLVKSQRMYTGGATSGVGPAVPGDATVPMYLGNSPASGMDAVVASFQRYTNPIDPQTAWSTYMAGNGSSSWNPFSGINVNLDILKNASTYSTITLW